MANLAKPSYLQARDLISALITPGNLNASGVIVWGTDIEMAIFAGGTGTWKAFELNNNPSLTNFMPSDMGVANYQNEYEDFDFTIRELTPVNGPGSLMFINGYHNGTAYVGYDFVRVDYIYRPRYKTTGTGVRLVAVGTRGPVRHTYSQGENLQEMTLKPINYGVWVGLSSATPPI